MFRPKLKDGQPSVVSVLCSRRGGTRLCAVQYRQVDCSQWVCYCTADRRFIGRPLAGKGRQYFERKIVHGVVGLFVGQNALILFIICIMLSAAATFRARSMC